MQSEKGLVLYQNKPFIEHIIEAVLPISNNIQLVTNTNDYNYLVFLLVLLQWQRIILDQANLMQFLLQVNRHELLDVLVVLN